MWKMKRKQKRCVGPALPPGCGCRRTDTRPAALLRRVRPRAVGYPHTDSMYFHQRGQINFWVPVTKVYDTNTLFVESAPGLQVQKEKPLPGCPPVCSRLVRMQDRRGLACLRRTSPRKCAAHPRACALLAPLRGWHPFPLGQDYHALTLNVGECARFYGNRCTHFTLANDTPQP